MDPRTTGAASAARDPGTGPPARSGSGAVAAIQPYVDDGCDEIHVTQIGRDQRGSMRFYEREAPPRFRSREPAVVGGRPG